VLYVNHDANNSSILRFEPSMGLALLDGCSLFQ